MDNVSYRIIDPNGSERTGQIERAKVSDYRGIKAFVEPILREVRADAPLEHVAVLYNGRRASMFVDELGAILSPPLAVNPKATEIYHAASKRRGVTIGPDDPKIHGRAILFDADLWR